MKHKVFKIKKRRWQIGNLYDSLVASKFDFFINTHRELRDLKFMTFPNKNQNLKKHNYQFNFINR